jgi:hypothetical protein
MCVRPDDGRQTTDDGLFGPTERNGRRRDDPEVKYARMVVFNKSLSVEGRIEATRVSAVE